MAEIDFSKAELKIPISTAKQSPLQLMPLLSPGSEDPSVRLLQRYLRRFGYLARGKSKPGVLDTETQGALQLYQRFHGISESGEFDADTQAHISLPRCGMPDEVMRLTPDDWESLRAEASPAYFIRCVWQPGITALRYAFTMVTNDIDQLSACNAVRRAFSTWQQGFIEAGANRRISFHEVHYSQTHDIQVAWVNAQHRLTPQQNCINLRGDAIAHAEYPINCREQIGGFPRPFHFDDSECIWSVSGHPNTFDIETIALHEIGHLLGFMHVREPSAIMREVLQANFVNHELSTNELEGLRFAYR